MCVPCFFTICRIFEKCVQFIAELLNTIRELIFWDLEEGERESVAELYNCHSNTFSPPNITKFYFYIYSSFS